MHLKAPRLLALLWLCSAGVACNADRDVPDGPCNDGICIGDTRDGGNDPNDPCSNVVCDMPPTQCHAAVGTCSDGQCSYALAPGQSCSDGNACTQGDLCAADGSCAGTPMACNTPPAPMCSDGDTSVVFDPQGSCSMGACNYTQQTVSCPGMCGSVMAGLCPDPCANRTCDTPPTPCYAVPGMCNEQTGACSYTVDSNITACDDNDSCTMNDTCQGDGSCLGTGVVCDQPPAPTCIDASTRRTFSANGAMCNAGTSMCDYPFTDTNCGPPGCSNGACNTNCDETSCQPWALPATPNGTAVRTCGDASCPTTTALPNLDENYFRCRLQPILEGGCAYMGCHTTDTPTRRLQTFAVNLKRMAPLLSGKDHDGPLNPGYCNGGGQYPEANCGPDPLMTQEWTFNFDNARLFALEAPAATNNELLTQPLAGDPRGHVHDNYDIFQSTNDVRYQAILGWLNGMTDPANCGGLGLPTRPETALGINTLNGTCPQCTQGSTSQCVPPPDTTYPCDPNACAR